MRQFGLPYSVSILLVLCVATATASPAQSFTTLASFDFKNGDGPVGPLVQGRDGNFYGTADGGGNVNNLCSFGCGTIFRITPTGKLAKLYSFCSNPNCPDGYSPRSGLVQGADGNFYGTTSNGGIVNHDWCTSGCGTIFKITRTGKLATLYSFCTQPNCTDGDGPWGGLVQGTDGNFYGTTVSGGSESDHCSLPGCGTIFKISPTGTLTTLYSFCPQANCTDGVYPEAALVQATDGNFYGTTPYGGTGANGGSGTIFRITSGGAFTTLYNFCTTDCSDGIFPAPPLIQGADGNLYGTTTGDAIGFQRKTQSSIAGTVFRITLAGSLTTLYSFCSQPNCADGEYPFAGLAQGTDGNFYGTTADGGTGSGQVGTVYEITFGGSLTTLYDFCSQPNCTDGNNPSDLVQGTDGSFYGLTLGGGIVSCEPKYGGCGTAFSLSVGLGPFVITRPTSGNIGTKVIILGNSLTGTTSVEFNGTPATFKVLSSTEITTKVPKGATTGFVTVTMPNGTLTSNVPFVVQ
jgi:uncharacterized repeat protein (TIGR03803 family)